LRCAVFTLSVGAARGDIAPLWGHHPVGSPPCGVTSLWGHLPVGAPPSARCGLKQPTLLIQTLHRREGAAPTRARLPSRPDAGPELWEERASLQAQVQAPSCGRPALGAMRPQTADFAYSIAPSPRGRGSHRSTLPITPRCKPQVVGAPPSARCSLKQPTLLIQSPHRREGAAPTGARFPSRPWVSPKLWEGHASHYAHGQAQSCGSAALGANGPVPRARPRSVASSPRGRGSHRGGLSCFMLRK